MVLALDGGLAGLIVFGLALLLIIPGIIWGVYYTFLIPSVAFGLSGMAALAETKRLVQGNWWRTVGCLIVLGLVSFAMTIPGIIMAMVSAMLAGDAEPGLVAEGIEWLSDVYVDIATLFRPVALTVFFFNRRSVVDRTSPCV